MASYTWPDTTGHHPLNLLEHATRLNEIFDLVSNAANARLSNHHFLPAGLHSSISTGITKGFAEARSNDYCPKLSEEDKGTLIQVMLKNISAEAARQARDRIPLAQFHGLHKWYNALHTKLLAKTHPTAPTHHSAATEIASVAGRVSLSEGTSKTAELTDTSEKLDTYRHAEKAKNVDREKGEDSSSGEEECEIKQSENKGDCQEARENEDSESGNDSNEDRSSDDGSGSQEESEGGDETESDAGSDHYENQEIVREVSVGNIVENTSGFSTAVNLQIKQQACVNRLEDAKAPELSDCLTVSLERLLREKQLPSQSMQISATSLIDDGDVKVTIHGETREGLQNIIDSAGWGEHFERTLIGSPVRIYKVIVHKVQVNSLGFRNRREKSAIIRKLAWRDYELAYRKGYNTSIGDIYWAKDSVKKMVASLIVEFLDYEQANEALRRGLCWQGLRHRCERADKEYRLRRCSRCQGYGHLSHECSAPYQCGKCAGQHLTATCKSKIEKCASCGGSHRADNSRCPVRAEARRSLEFKDESPSQATKPASEAAKATPSPRLRQSQSATGIQTVASIPSPVSLDADSIEDETESPPSQPNQPLPVADLAQATSPDTTALVKRLEDLEKVVMALDPAQRTKSSGRTKRRVGEAFTGGTDAESSNVAAKRVKQELHRQPSPYIVHRPN